MSLVGNPKEMQRIEFLEAVLEFHEPNTPPSTCMWCGLPSPCPPYSQAKAALAEVGNQQPTQEGEL